MGKKSKKSNVEVAAAPVVMSGKKGKRDAEKAIAKPLPKKQKKEVMNTVLQSDAKKPKKVAAPLPKKKPESSSSEEDSAADSSSDEEPVPKPVIAGKKSAAAPKKKPEPISSEEESESDASSDEEPAKPVAAPKKQGAAVTNGSAAPKSSKMEEESDSESSGGSDDDEEEEPTKIVAAPAKNASKPVKKEGSDDSEGDGSDEDSDDEDDESSEEEPSKPAQKPTKPSTQDSSEEGSEESSDDSEDEKPSKTSKKDKDVEMKDVPPAKAQKSANGMKAPATQTQASGSKTLFVGNLSFSVDADVVTEFFKEAGEVIDVRLAVGSDGRFRGFGHVEFAAAEGAQKALELNGQELMGREVKLDLAHERGPFTPQSGTEKGSFQRGAKPQGQTIFIKGFDKFQDEDQIRSSLEEHFGTCGEISRVSIPKDFESGASKGIAYMDFTDSDAISKALELNGSCIGDYSLTVDEAKPKSDNRDGGRSGGFSSGGGRGRRGRGRFDDRGRGGRGRGGNRGRGGFTHGSGKKTTFRDD